MGLKIGITSRLRPKRMDPNVKVFKATKKISDGNTTIYPGGMFVASDLVLPARRLAELFRQRFFNYTSEKVQENYLKFREEQALQSKKLAVSARTGSW